MLLAVYCGIGVAVAYVVVSGLDYVYEPTGRLLRTAAEVGAGEGAAYWLLALWLVPSGASSSLWAVRQIVVQLVVLGVIWSVVSWPFAMWELERRLKVPYHRSYDVTARLCGVTLLLLLAANAGARVVAAR